MRYLALGFLVCVFACGDNKKQPPTPPPGPSKAEVQKKDEAKKKREAEARQARENKITALKQQKAELAATVRELRAALKGMDQKHEEEKKALPDPRKLRPYLMGLIRDSNSESARLDSMERNLAELEKKVAGTAVTGELKTLQDQMKAVEERYWKAHSGWMASLEEAKFGGSDESPVKRDLATLRAIRTEWFKMTPDARRGTAGGSAKKIINDGFRTWLGAEPDRKRIAQAIVSKSPDGYDFTDLKFFLLLSKHEFKLEKQNIVEEQKVLDENRVKLEGIEKEMDQLREQIAQKMAQGGGDLERYQDLKSRIQGQRTKAENLKRMVAEYQETFSEIEAVTERQFKEQEDTSAALEKAEKELRKVTGQLRQMGVR